VALASAVLLLRGGHHVRIWSARADEREAVQGGISATGNVTGEFFPEASTTAAQCVTGADVVIVAAPAYAHEALFDRVVPHLHSGQHVVMHSATALTSLLLARKLAEQGVAPTIIDLSTSVCTARKSDTACVALGKPKPGVNIASLPAANGHAAASLMTGLFGELFTLRSNILDISLNNHNAIYHVPAFLFNLALVERRSPWNLWDVGTPFIAGYIDRLDRERLAIASAFGVEGIPLLSYLRDAMEVQASSLVEAFSAMAKQRPNARGPNSLDDRYISEDVPFGLVFFTRLAEIADVSVECTRTLVAFLSSLYSRDFSVEGHSLADLGLAGATTPDVLEVVTTGTKPN